MISRPTAQRDRSAKFIFAVCLFAFAFTLRVVFAIEWQAMPYGTSPLLDAQIYDQWAWDLARGGGAVSHAYYQSPLYPYLLSLLYRLVGHSYFGVSLLNDLIDSSTVVLLSAISYSLFGRAAAFLTGLLAACYAPMIFYAAPPMKEPLALFLLSSFVFMGMRALQKNRAVDYLLCGLAFGLSVLTRGNVLLLAPIVPLLAGWRYRRQSLKGSGLFILGMLISMSPVTWHNYKASHSFIPVTYADGFNLYIGHSSYANGTNAYPPEVATGPEQERLDTTYIAQQQSQRVLTPLEVSSFWRSKAIDFALHNPGREVELFALKLFAFWNGGDSFDNYDVRFIKQNFPSLLNLPLTGFWLVAALAAFSVFGSPRRSRDRPEEVLLLTCTIMYMLAVLLFYVTDRYRLPVIVFLFPLAGAAAPCFLRLWRARDHKKIALAVSGMLAFLVVGLHAPLSDVDLSAFDWGTLTAVYADKGEVEPTLAAFHKAVTISSQQAGPQAYVHAAGIYERLGQMDEAQNLIQSATEIFPQDGIAFYNLGRMQAMRGHLKEALSAMRKAQELAPTYALVYFGLAVIYEKIGDRPKARDAVRDGLLVDPQEPHLLSLIGEKGPKNLGQ